MQSMELAHPPRDVVASSSRRIHDLLSTGDRAVWATAALALVAGDGGTPQLRRSAESLLAALGIFLEAPPGSGIERVGVAAQAAAPLLQASALLGGGDLWADQPDEALIAQGRASAQGAVAFEQLGLPFMPGLAEALASPGAVMLDVGTGVAALAASYAELFPELTVVGIDVLPRVLGLARDILRTSPVADRVILREQDVSQLTDVSTYALAWLPAPFVPEQALRTALPLLARSLLPGGWLIVGHGKYGDDPLDEAVTRFKTVAYGGTPLDNNQAQELLTEAGLIDVTTVSTPSGAPAITIGRRTPPETSTPA